MASKTKELPNWARKMFGLSLKGGEEKIPDIVSRLVEHLFMEEMRAHHEATYFVTVE